jgi:hypothetical protein
MSNITAHGLITGAYYPLIFREQNSEKINMHKEANRLFEDKYFKSFAKLGIDRHEMMIVMPQLMAVDVLSQNEVLNYVF